MKFHEFLREKRKSLGLSQVNFAKIAGFKPETIVFLENARTAPTDLTVWRIGATLCLSVAEIREALSMAEYARNNPDELEWDSVMMVVKRSPSHSK